MEKVEMAYYEGADGLLYPDLALPEEEEKMLQDMGKYGLMAMNYLIENHKDRYMELKILGGLPEVLQKAEMEAYQMMELLEEDYLKKNLPENPFSTMEMWNIKEQARRQAEEIVLSEIVMKLH